MEGMIAKIVRPGFLTTVQDLGRPGYRQSGVTPGGAADPHALRVANLLVGNEESDAGLEVTLGGLRLRFSKECGVAWGGGAFDVRIGLVALPAGRACLIPAGTELTLGHPASGCRAWIALSGGINVPLLLGSRSTDLRGGFGGLDGRALREGDWLQLGRPLPRAKEVAMQLRGVGRASWGAPAEWACPRSSAGGLTFLRVVRGADAGRFSSATMNAFLTQGFDVSSDSDRMGTRLHGPELPRSGEGADLVSEAVAPGTVQVPPGGHPILLLADCQTIGGYPKLAHVITVDLPLAAQLRPGDHVHFREVPLAEAHRLLRQRALDLARFRLGLSLHR